MLNLRQKRIAVINKDKCKPKKCKQECKKRCPVNSIGKKCIDIEDIAVIAENLCIGCNSCVRYCPFGAINIVNLPKELNLESLSFQYGENLFRIYNLPIIKQGYITGFLGENGIGKSTIINIISGSIIPNFGDYGNLNDRGNVLKHLKGNECQKYYKNLYDKKIKVVKKIQNINSLIEVDKYKNMTVYEFMKISLCGKDVEETLNNFDINYISTNKLSELSGGELQKVYCCYIICKEADVYIFDEPTNYLDISQRVILARNIRNLISENKYVIVVDHDISFLDYICDRVCILYGKPGAYGILSTQYNTSNAINIYFEGYLPTENVRFRKDKIKYNISLCESNIENSDNESNSINYNGGNIEYPNFKLEIEDGNISNHGSINVIIGKNGVGKTSFVKKLAKELGYNISMKPQYPNFDKLLEKHPRITVNNFLARYIETHDETFKNDVVNTLDIKNILDKELSKLSGGELQKISIIYCLGKKADIYIIDEPSASLDIQQRINMTRAIKRYIMNKQKIAFVIEHDITMAFILANNLNGSVITFKEIEINNGTRKCKANKPSKLEGESLNNFLKDLNITLRKSFNDNRYKINRFGSTKDIEQKKENKYFVN